ncbi:hypothetical protein PHYSODRAFT_325038 [Phytophthora sojae]|uniref:Uncharacterized protein n=1 Tax=Phytophthora sojae (strain P6497) TaxID=1094619 RepID=G4YXK1_PHYSP|nr:hypothetical protein PHYSODRAFT_325038 [Phytophthora sojae]EGZ23862.1 hypothetical protein PHYSODRAFT_325038 [Phytophthora sojae]|eukprot:XP_009519150.1 hypothetical protein PHYSODRAFT_325038 [Phytophthora sojae]
MAHKDNNTGVATVIGRKCEDKVKTHRLPAVRWSRAFETTGNRAEDQGDQGQGLVQDQSSALKQVTETAEGASSGPADAQASPEKAAEDDEFSADDGDKQAEADVIMADPEAVAASSQSDAGRKRAQASMAAVAAKPVAATEAEEASARKRSASRSPHRDDYHDLFGDSKSEEGAIRECGEVSNNLDEQQQQYYAAVSGSHARQWAAATAVEPSSGGGTTYAQGCFPPESGTGAPALFEKLTALPARCVLAPHKLILKELTTLRKKPEDKGGLHPVRS